jgi:hypothetical protein
VDIILSWSGTDSREVAETFKGWIPRVNPALRPWISTQDIAKGKRWFDELMKPLSTAKSILVFVTPSNVRSSWIYYEVGCVAVRQPTPSIYPYLVGIDTKHVRDTPLGQFQATEASKSDTLALIRSLNTQLDSPLDDKFLESSFEREWHILNHRIEESINLSGRVTDPVADLEPSVEEQLSERARRLLVEASALEPGRILHRRAGESPGIIAGHLDTKDEGSGTRNLKRWEAALKELIQLKLVEQFTPDGPAVGYELTDEGWEVAGLLKSRGAGR